MGISRVIAASFVTLGALLVAPPAQAATVPSGFTDNPTFVSGLNTPTAMEIAPDGRLFVAEKGGSLRVVKNGQLLSTPFVSLTVNDDGERGLLGVAFDPDFATNHYVYVYYTTPGPPIHNRVSRFTANGDVAVAGSELPILDLDSLSAATNHNGGAIHFGPDGKLYVAVGENATPANAQTLGNRLGKMLRINSNGSIPTDNPFYSAASGANRSIWAVGLRNPYTFAFQPGTGRMFINDVGQNAWEEIDLGSGGANYGWPAAEGPAGAAGYARPVFSYPHSGNQPAGCSIAGGAFYNPDSAQFPSAYVGDYFFADLCSGWIYSYDLTSKKATQFATGITNPVDLKVGADGSLYYLAYGAGTVGRISYATRQTFYLNDQNDASGPEYAFNFGAPSGSVLACDWDGNGTETPGVVRNGQWQLRNSNSAGAVDVTFSYGRPTDVPLCGDWDGNGTETPGLRRGNVFYLRNSNSTGNANVSFAYGKSSDKPIVGDWNGTGGDGVGIVRGNAYYLTNRLNGSRDVAAFTFGSSSDTPLSGDWDGNGTSTIGVRRGNVFYLRNVNSGGVSVRAAFGRASDLPLVGDWNGDRSTTVGAVRRS